VPDYLAMDEDQDAVFDTGGLFGVADFLADDVVDAIEEIGNFLGADGARDSFRIVLWLGALQKPGGGPPILGRGLADRADGSEFGVELCSAKLSVELLISPGLALDGQRAAADVAGSGRESAAGMDEGTDLVLLGLTEFAWSGHGGESGVES